MKYVTVIFFIICFTLSFLYLNREKESHVNNQHTYTYVNELTVTEYIEQIKDDSNTPDDSLFNHILMIRGMQDSNWITHKDFKYLATLILSEVRAKCIMTQFSSTIPHGKTTLGNQTLFLIDAYRNKSHYQNHLILCGEMEETQRNELIKWVKTQI
tara:strand:- start:349 stop:816 length:468 start_codon:yes stop_codon:yes gene_type:complete